MTLRTASPSSSLNRRHRMHCIHVLTGSPAWQTKAICSSLASRACINEVMAHWTESHDCLKARVLAAATGKDILAPGRFAPGSSSKKAFTLTRKDVRSRSYKPVLHGALLRFGMQPPPKTDCAGGQGSNSGGLSERDSSDKHADRSSCLPHQWARINFRRVASLRL